MSNKTKLQENNASLQSVMTAVSNIPLPEEMKHGLYVWKKYSNNPREKYTITATQLNTVTKKEAWLNFRMDSDEIDITTVTAHFWIGKTIRRVEGEKYLAVTFSDSSQTRGVESPLGGESTYPTLVRWNASEKTLQFQISYITEPSIVEWTVEHHDMKPIETLDYAISDDPNKYPHRAFYTDGYWYEKAFVGIPIPYGISTVSIDKLTYTSKVYATNISHHSLGEIPRLVIVFANAKAPELSGFEYEWGSFSTRTGGGAFLTGTTQTGATATATKISTNLYPSVYFKKGVEYTVITMV